MTKIIAENKAYLMQKHPYTWQYLSQLNEITNIEENLFVEETRSGQPTILLMQENSKVYLHSKYDPSHEAEQLISQYEHGLDRYDHILFYGIGLGYHVEKFMDRYAEKEFSLYEPDVRVVMKFLSLFDLSRLPVEKLKKFYVEYVPAFSSLFLDDFVKNHPDNVLVVIHPAYERIFKEKTQNFISLYQEAASNQRMGLGVKLAYNILWTINSIHNFTKVLEVPNMIRDKKEYFEGKPVIIVAAGPSLQYEIENLRKIKKERLAYIFAVGSANKALLSYGIKPDAVTSYDPNVHNVDVFKEIIDENIKDIPMIFGTSVGYKTVQLYPGPLLYMINSQDHLTPYYLQGDGIIENKEIIFDAATIAVITLQLLTKMNVSKIILVGQNFSYLNDQYYSQGINYELRSTFLTDEDKRQQFIEIENVDGVKVLSDINQINGLKQMEIYINNIQKAIPVINTTVSGAKIQGTEFKKLEEVIQQDLVEPVVNERWCEKQEPSVNWFALQEQAEKMHEDFNKLDNQFKTAVRTLKKIESMYKLGKLNKLPQLFIKFDNAFTFLVENNFYKVFFQPIILLNHEHLARTVDEIRSELDLKKKAAMVVEEFGRLILLIQACFMDISDLYIKLDQIIRITIQENS